MFFKIINKFRTAVWKITKPTTIGVKVMCFNGEKILLMKPVYSTMWHLPGGGVKKGEEPQTAAKREILEECGIEIDNLTLQNIYLNTYEGKIDYIIIYEARYESNISSISTSEVKECGFFSPHEIENVSPGTKRRVKEYIGGSLEGGKW